MNRAKHLLIFLFGTSVGVAATYLAVKRKYEQIAQEEIDSVKEIFHHDTKDVLGDVVLEKRDEGIYANFNDTELAKETLHSIINNESYTQYNNIVDDGETKDIPYVISPDDYGEIDEYEQIELTYYEDGVLADDNDNIIKNIDDIIGYDSLSHFGEYEDDSVFVKNDKLKCYYEILKDYRCYDEAVLKGD